MPTCIPLPYATQATVWTPTVQGPTPIPGCHYAAIQIGPQHSMQPPATPWVTRAVPPVLPAQAVRVPQLPVVSATIPTCPVVQRRGGPAAGDAQEAAPTALCTLSGSAVASSPPLDGCVSTASTLKAPSSSGMTSSDGNGNSSSSGTSGSEGGHSKTRRTKRDSARLRCMTGGAIVPVQTEQRVDPTDGSLRTWTGFLLHHARGADFSYGEELWIKAGGTPRPVLGGKPDIGAVPLCVLSAVVIAEACSSAQGPPPLCSGESGCASDSSGSD
eukprot:TRINITY_DN4651_c0_g2_i1.p1 TRINITY_DN4651_c0_g2~~TRINITY_DN4651_c0_g2_i1.p1  ORF type:complete len:313 (+),score=47.96 TRINITY_DN4651_c0_g2_i1:125-940(+)